MMIIIKDISEDVGRDAAEHKYDTDTDFSDTGDDVMMMMMTMMVTMTITIRMICPCFLYSVFDQQVVYREKEFIALLCWP